MTKHMKERLTFSQTCNFFDNVVEALEQSNTKSHLINRPMYEHILSSRPIRKGSEKVPSFNSVLNIDLSKQHDVHFD